MREKYLVFVTVFVIVIYFLAKLLI